MLKKIINYFLLLFFFLIPWQTRWVFERRFLNGGFWEYGSGSFYITEILLWIIIILSFVDLARRNGLWQSIRFGQGNKRNLAIGLFVICYLLFTIFFSISPAISFNFVFRLIGAACLATVILSIAKNLVGQSRLDPSVATLPQDDKTSMLFAFWAGGIVQGILATWQFLSQKVVHWPFSGIAPHLPQDLGAFVIEVGDERWLRAYGSFGSPNILGGFLSIVLVFGLLLYVKAKPGWGRAVLALGQMAITVGLVLSFSRAAWVAAIIGVVVFIAILNTAKNFWLTQSTDRDSLSPPGLHSGQAGLLGMTVKLLLFSLAVVIVLFVAFKPLFLVRAGSIGRLEQMSLTSRQEQFGEWKKIFKEHLIFGVGPGAYTYDLYNSNPTLPVWRYQPVHNIYLLIIVELGIVGFACVMSLCCVFVLLVWKHNRIFFPILISILVLGFFDHWLWSMYSGLMVASTGISLMFYQKEKSPDQAIN